MLMLCIDFFLGFEEKVGLFAPFLLASYSENCYEIFEVVQAGLKYLFQSILRRNLSNVKPFQS